MGRHTHPELLKSLGCRTFNEKPRKLRKAVLQALDILTSLGIPIDSMTPRRAERMSLAFLALADTCAPDTWQEAKSLTEGRVLTSREIIDYVNTHFQEDVSRGSYDDVRRLDLRLPLAAQIVVHSAPESARNDGTRAYALSPEVVSVVRRYATDGWDELAATLVERLGDLGEELAAKRDLAMLPVTLSNGAVLRLEPGNHNLLQRAIIEDFLPRFGNGAEVLYLGDAANKRLHVDEERLRQLNFFDLDHGELPDVVAYSRTKNWIFLIEAVHSSGPIDPVRRRRLTALASRCTSPIVFVTAFADRATFRKFIADLAWEQEIWIASEPTHMVHFNGDKFLGPYQPQP